MKKTYMTPAVEIEHAVAAQMMALSLLEEDAVKDNEVLAPEDNMDQNVWNMWED